MEWFEVFDKKGGSPFIGATEILDKRGMGGIHTVYDEHCGSLFAKLFCGCPVGARLPFFLCMTVEG